jgi:hypothetical protein
MSDAGAEAALPVAADAPQAAAAAAAPAASALGALLAGARAAAKQPAGAAAGSKRKNSSGGGGGGGSASGAAAAAAATRRRGSDAPGGGGSSFEACPLCGRALHRALLAAHAQECAGAASPPPPAPPPPPPPLPPPLPPPPACTPVGSVGASAAGAAPPASAFAVLLASAARAAPSVFSLDLLPDGTFAAHWAAPGSCHVSSSASGSGSGVAPAWRETVDVRDKGAPGGVVRVTLRTNVPSGGAADAPAPFRWPHAPPPPGEGAPHFAPGPLKSAVQKAVRRCAPGAAVRAAATLAALDAQEALRRLCVIAIEDAILPPEHLALMTWLMGARMHTRTLVRACFSSLCC